MNYQDSHELFEGELMMFPATRTDLTGYKSLWAWLHMQLAERGANGLSIVRWDDERGRPIRYGDDAHVPKAYIATSFGV